VTADDPFTLPVRGEVVDEKNGIVGRTKGIPFTPPTRRSAVLGSPRGAAARVR
jgi:hypothetical protein